jgi:archaellum component FlaC
MKARTALIAISIMVALAFFVSCGSQEETSEPETEVTAEDVKNEAAEAVETAADYTLEQKEAYMQKIDTQLEEIDREIGVLGNKIETGTDEMKAEGRAKLEASLNALRAQKEAAAQQYEKLKASSGAAWDDLKAGMDGAMEKLNAAFDQAKAEFE